MSDLWRWREGQQNRTTFFRICCDCSYGKRNLAACCCNPSWRRTLHQCDIRRVITRVELKTGWAIVKKVLQTASSNPLLLNGSSSRLNDVENIYEDRLSCANSRSPSPTPACARSMSPACSTSSEMQMVFDFLERAEMTFHSNQCGIILFYVSAIVAHLANWHMLLYEQVEP